MTWFKVDDGFHSHRKVLAMRRRKVQASERVAAAGLWALAGSWCSENLTDGFVPDYLPEELGASEDLARVLVRVGLWSATDGGWVFHQWHEDGDGSSRQPRKVDVEKRRQDVAARQARWRANRSTRDDRVSNAPVDALRNAPVDAYPEDAGETCTRPDPTRPIKNYSPPVVPSPTREPVENRGGGIPRGTDGFDHHPHHDNAKAVCIRWVEERKLPIAAPELLAWCYRLGNGDPWEGHRLVGRHTEAELDSARNPLATVRARLRDATHTRRDTGADVIQLEPIGRIG